MGVGGYLFFHHFCGFFFFAAVLFVEFCFSLARDTTVAAGGCGDEGGYGETVVGVSVGIVDILGVRFRGNDPCCSCVVVASVVVFVVVAVFERERVVAVVVTVFSCLIVLLVFFLLLIVFSMPYLNPDCMKQRLQEQEDMDSISPLSFFAFSSSVNLDLDLSFSLSPSVNRDPRRGCDGDSDLTRCGMAVLVLLKGCCEWSVALVHNDGGLVVVVSGGYHYLDFASLFLFVSHFRYMLLAGGMW